MPYGGRRFRVSGATKLLASCRPSALLAMCRLLLHVVHARGVLQVPLKCQQSREIQALEGAAVMAGARGWSGVVCGWVRVWRASSFLQFVADATTMQTAMAASMAKTIATCALTWSFCAEAGGGEWRPVRGASVGVGQRGGALPSRRSSLIAPSAQLR